MRSKTCSVIGLGYIGLPTALILADNGFLVSGYDTNEDVISNLKSGHVHIKEEGLNKLFKKRKVRENFTFSNDLENSDIYIVAVPTPIDHESEIPTPNVDFVIEAVLKISRILKEMT